MGADAGRVPELLLGLRWAESEDSDLTAPGLRDLYGLLDGAFLVRACSETQVGGVDSLTVVGGVDPGSGSRHPLNADKDLHGAGQDFIRESAGSKIPPGPATATFTGKVSFMYMTRRSVPTTACLGGR